jgi:hypothetical protein
MTPEAEPRSPRARCASTSTVRARHGRPSSRAADGRARRAGHVSADDAPGRHMLAAASTCLPETIADGEPRTDFELDRALRRLSRTDATVQANAMRMSCGRELTGQSTSRRQLDAPVSFTAAGPAHSRSHARHARVRAAGETGEPDEPADDGARSPQRGSRAGAGMGEPGDKMTRRADELPTGRRLPLYAHRQVRDDSRRRAAPIILGWQKRVSRLSRTGATVEANVLRMSGGQCLSMMRSLHHTALAPSARCAC